MNDLPREIVAELIDGRVNIRYHTQVSYLRTMAERLIEEAME